MCEKLCEGNGSNEKMNPAAARKQKSDHQKVVLFRFKERSEKEGLKNHGSWGKQAEEASRPAASTLKKEQPFKLENHNTTPGDELSPPQDT